MKKSKDQNIKKFRVLLLKINEFKIIVLKIIEAKIIETIITCFLEPMKVFANIE